MKNSIITITSFLLLTTNAFAQFSPGEIGYNKSIESLYASLGIWQINRFQTNPEFGNEEFLYSISLIDENGKVTEEKYPSLESYFSTDDEGYGDDTSHYFYEYSAANMVSHITSLGFDLNTEETYFVYNDKGQLIEKTEASAEARRYTFEYDNKGNIVKAIGQTPIFTSGEDGTPVDIQSWNNIDFYIYKWNDKNQLTEVQFHYDGGFYSKTLYSYEGSKCTGLTIFTDEKSKTPDSVATLTYNTNGTLNKMIMISNYSDSRIAYRYTYDSN